MAAFASLSLLSLSVVGATHAGASSNGTVVDPPYVGFTSFTQSHPAWEVTSSGLVTGLPSYGDLVGVVRLNKPIVGMAATNDGKGYWLVASDGGIFSFGDAPFLGSTGGSAINTPIVGMASSPDGGGYWLVAADGGVFSFGDAPFMGSGAGLSSSPAIGMFIYSTSYYVVLANGTSEVFGPPVNLDASPASSAVAM